MSFTVLGNQKLALERHYNSFSEKNTPCGPGWRIGPFELELHTERIIAKTQQGDEVTSYPMILVKTPDVEAELSKHL